MGNVVCMQNKLSFVAVSSRKEKIRKRDIHTNGLLASQVNFDSRDNFNSDFYSRVLLLFGRYGEVVVLDVTTLSAFVTTVFFCLRIRITQLLLSQPIGTGKSELLG